jgi:TM2 domain-containing membrane protein YozV
MSQEPYKICPRCSQPAVLAAVSCARCGHEYRTKFVELDQTQMVAPPPPTYQPPPSQYAPPHSPPPYTPGSPYAPQPIAPYAEQKSKVAAALFAFFLGAFGVHGFYLGNNSMGVTYLALTLVSLPLILVLVGLIWWFIVGPLCLIQAILYIVSTDQDFHQKYVVEKRWF